MQLSLALDQDNARIAARTAHVAERLHAAFGGFAHNPRLAPVDQLVNSMVASGAHDEVSWPAYLRLKAAFRPWERLAQASPAEVETIIAPVTHARIKAGWLPEALQRIV